MCAGGSGELWDVSATVHGDWVLPRTGDHTGHGPHSVWHRVPGQPDLLPHSHHQQWGHRGKVLHTQPCYTHCDICTIPTT